jgi:hypothetical protein
MTKTLLVDGNYLLKVGFCGVKDFFNGTKHIGGLWHFINTIRRLIDEENFDKVVVMCVKTKNGKKYRIPISPGGGRGVL